MCCFLLLLLCHHSSVAQDVVDVALITWQKLFICCAKWSFILDNMAVCGWRMQSTSEHMHIPECVTCYKRTATLVIWLSIQPHKLTGSPPRQRGQQSGEALGWITLICVNIHQQIIQKSETRFHKDQKKCKHMTFLLRVVHTCCSCCWLDRGNVWDISIGHSAERSSISRHTRFWKPL